MKLHRAQKIAFSATLLVSLFTIPVSASPGDGITIIPVTPVFNRGPVSKATHVPPPSSPPSAPAPITSVHYVVVEPCSELGAFICGEGKGQFGICNYAPPGQTGYQAIMQQLAPGDTRCDGTVRTVTTVITAPESDVASMVHGSGPPTVPASFVASITKAAGPGKA